MKQALKIINYPRIPQRKKTVDIYYNKVGSDDVENVNIEEDPPRSFKTVGTVDVANLKSK